MQQNFNDLPAFVTVAREDSFTRAAAQLCVITNTAAVPKGRKAEETHKLVSDVLRPPGMDQDEVRTLDPSLQGGLQASRLEATHRFAGARSLKDTRLNLFPDKPSQRHHDHLTHTYLQSQVGKALAEMIANHTPNY